MFEKSNLRPIQKFEWDQEKNISNISKHGLDFDIAKLCFLEPILVRIDDRKNYGEERREAIGMVFGLIVHVIFTIRNTDTIRLISAWKGGRDARKAYRDAFLG